ncbi:hypothetical protein [Streptomyces sp. Agncl-13]
MTSTEALIAAADAHTARNHHPRLIAAADLDRGLAQLRAMLGGWTPPGSF